MIQKTKKVAMILSGCGYLDGTEITEGVSFLIALGQAGAQVTCFAPTLPLTPMDHLTGSALDAPPRDVRQESARIARGHVRDLTELQAREFDALVLPGGFGAAKSLSDWATTGSRAHVHPEVERTLREFHRESKPIGAACIAPTLLAKVFGKQKITVTIGNDATTAAEIEKTGTHHEYCPVDDYVTDREHKIITTPAYMYEAQAHEVFRGISGLVKELIEMA